MSSEKNGASPSTADLFCLQEPLSSNPASEFEAFEKCGLVLKQDWQSLSPGPFKERSGVLLELFSLLESSCRSLVCFLFLSLEESVFIFLTL